MFHITLIKYKQYLVSPSAGKIRTIKSRKIKVFLMIEWFLCERVQWLSHSSECDTMKGSNAATVHSSNVGKNSDITGLC